MGAKIDASDWNRITDSELSLWRIRELRSISKKYYRESEGALTHEEIERYIDFFEDVGLYVSRKLVDLDLIDESFGDYIIDCYQDDAVMKHIGSARGEERDPSYWEHFEDLAKELLKRKEQRRRKQDRRR